MDNVTIEKLKAKHGDKAFDVFAEIAELGGFGTVTKDHTGGIDAQYEGGLDVSGVLDPANTAVHSAKKERIKKLIEGPVEKEPKK